MQPPASVAALRAELKRLGLTGFVLPRADRHQNEYVLCLRRTAGLAVIRPLTRPAGLAPVKAGRQGRSIC